jgi:hypothetical protein
MASDEIEQLLNDGWEIAGYSVCLMVAGALSHHVLLKKASELKSVAVVVNGGKELGRATTVLSPAPIVPEKKGFFG